MYVPSRHALLLLSHRSVFEYIKLQDFPLSNNNKIKKQQQQQQQQQTKQTPQQTPRQTHQKQNKNKQTNKQTNNPTNKQHKTNKKNKYNSHKKSKSNNYKPNCHAVTGQILITLIILVKHSAFRRNMIHKFFREREERHETKKSQHSKITVFFLGGGERGEIRVWRGLVFSLTPCAARHHGKV